MSAVKELKAAKAELKLAEDKYAAEEARIVDKYHPLKLGDRVTVETHDEYFLRDIVVQKRWVFVNHNIREWCASGNCLDSDGKEIRGYQGTWRKKIRGAQR